MHEPEPRILDEPIAGLDPLVQQSFHDLLGEVVAQRRTVFLSSHTLSEVERVAHRVAILRRGRLAVVDSLDSEIDPNTLIARKYPLPGGGEGTDLYITQSGFRTAFAADTSRGAQPTRCGQRSGRSRKRRSSRCQASPPGRRSGRGISWPPKTARSARDSALHG